MRWPAILAALSSTYLSAQGPVPKLPTQGPSVTENLARILSPRIPRLGTYVYSCTFNAHADDYDGLAHQLQKLGVVRVRLSTSAKTLPIDPDYVDRVKDFNRAMHARGIEVYALYLQDALFLHDPAKVSLRTQQMIGFHTGAFAGVQVNEQFDGLDLDVEPVQDPLWGGATWAVKDLLVQDLLFNVVAVVRGELVLQLGAAAAELPVSVGVQHYLHDRVLSGDLTVGKTDDFLAAGADVVSLFDYDDDLSDLVSRATAEVRETTAPHSIEIVLKTKNDGLSGQTFYEEGCQSLRGAAVMLMAKLDALSPADNLVPEVVVYEYDSFQELCGAGPPLCGP